MANLKEERLLILTMLKEDKLKIEDALSLLKTIKKTAREFEEDIDLSEERNAVLNMVYSGKLSAEEAKDIIKVIDTKEPNKEIQKEVQEKFNNFTESIENIAKDIGKKTTSLIKENEPKFKKLGRLLLEKSTKVANKVSSSLNEKLEKIKDRENK